MSYLGLTQEEKFEKFAVIGPREECWPWKGYISDQGYGLIRCYKFNIRAHRFAYEKFVGPIPEGLVLDHLCRNRACVNPYHLEPVTLVDNLNRGIRTNAHAKWTHCIRGHEFTEENTRDNNGKRECRTCRTLRGQIGFVPIRPYRRKSSAQTMEAMAR